MNRLTFLKTAAVVSVGATIGICGGLLSNPVQVPEIPHTYHAYASDDDDVPTYIEKKTEPTAVRATFKEETGRELSKEDQYLLARMVMAEAEDEDLYGQALVVLVILNRVDSPDFPDTVKDVIFQAGQFSPVSNGRWDAVEPNDDAKIAVYFATEGGWDGSQGATYFVTPENSSWHETNLEHLFDHGGHRFYREYPDEGI